MIHNFDTMLHTLQLFLVASIVFSGVTGQTTPSPTGVAPRITSSWDSVIQLNYGDSLDPLDCRAEGTPTPAVSWQREGTSQVLDNPISFQYTTYTQEGTYTCVATSPDFPPASKNVTIDVTGPPAILGPEVVDLSDQKGQQVRMECRARGDPPVSQFDWFVGRGRAQPVQSEGNPDYSLEEDLTGSPATSTLTIMSLKDSLADEYACWAMNTDGQKDMKQFNVKISAPAGQMGITGKDGAIAGGVVGALVIMTIIAVVVFYFWKRKQPKSRTDADGNNYEFHEL
ncbi:kin of IRRE-like protein 1 isoform X1 [Branchiostoma floridae x Branchiostoma belcheri]